MARAGLYRPFDDLTTSAAASAAASERLRVLTAAVEWGALIRAGWGAMGRASVDVVESIAILVNFINLPPPGPPPSRCGAALTPLGEK
jgi:hypothetical protein